jgi:elongation factor P
MAKLDYNEIKPGVVIIHDEQPFEVIASHSARKSMGKPSNQVKMKNLINGKVIEVAFHAADMADEADLIKREVKFLYSTPKGEFWFCAVDNPANRFTISSEIIGEMSKFLKSNTIVKVKIFEYNDEEKIIGLILPVKMDFKIIDCPPNVRGDTATGGSKIATIETGAKVNVPLFVNNGEIIRVNTETGEYVERVRE